MPPPPFQFLQSGYPGLSSWSWGHQGVYLPQAAVHATAQGRLHGDSHGCGSGPGGQGCFGLQVIGLVLHVHVPSGAGFACVRAAVLYFHEGLWGSLLLMPWSPVFLLLMVTRVFSGIVFKCLRHLSATKQQRDFRKVGGHQLEFLEASNCYTLNPKNCCVYIYYFNYYKW